VKEQLKKPDILRQSGKKVEFIGRRRLSTISSDQNKKNLDFQTTIEEPSDKKTHINIVDS
jgi:hypothetical protein